MPNHRSFLISLSLVLGFNVAVGILLGKDVIRRDFVLCAVATFWAISLVGIYPGKASKRSLYVLLEIEELHL